jgi:hydroxymethylpyrimidine/phosphomethylpyrimidine kinase
MEAVPRVLTIAGSDPSGGAGIQADLKTFSAYRVYGMAVITSLTAQNTRAVTGIHDVPPQFITAQLETVFDDIEVDAAKTGMLKSEAIIEAVAASLEERFKGYLVVDPVMVATSGDMLIEESAVKAQKRVLLRRATLVTPNRAEAEVLAGMKIRTPDQAADAARRILDFGPRAVLVKGILDRDDVVDLLAQATEQREFRRPRIEVRATHGSGCTLSSALAAALALGLDLPQAVESAKDFVWRAIESAWPVGGGSLPLDHLVGRPRRQP